MLPFPLLYDQMHRAQCTVLYCMDKDKDKQEEWPVAFLSRVCFSLNAERNISHKRFKNIHSYSQSFTYLSIPLPYFKCFQRFDARR